MTANRKSADKNQLRLRFFITHIFNVTSTKLYGTHLLLLALHSIRADYYLCVCAKCIPTTVMSRAENVHISA